ncbi:uncharacterized protein LOC117611558 [Osmia lignaria lignaria]|uniref:uncharacterized protein LOC117611558 n=1 Tax=Osmia lignaria lignaria TaxID=1437193 RepID=UPI00402B2E3B
METASPNRRQPGEEGIVDDAKKVQRNTVADEQDGQGTARLIAGERTNTQTKIASTQTSIDFAQTNEKNLQITEAISNVYRSSSCVCFERKRSTEFRGVDEEPAPQWLIEEALNRGSRSERWTKGKISSSKEIEYQKIISKLESRLAQIKEDLEEALQSKSLVKEKYKRSLENIKMKAREESEMLQEKIVQICTSVLEKFGPSTIVDKRKSNYQIKCRGRLKYHEKISSKLHKKLRMAVVRSNKLKRELTAARKALKNKSEMYESISKCFDELKRDMDTTEMNLNNLISENLSLRKKIDDTRDWLAERNAEKVHHASNHLRDAQKNRELSNLKKKLDEDKATIDQLRNRLMRSESANTNKGFLLNSYKSQLTDLNQEKNRLVSKINSLENEISVVRNNNSQLKAKISILNNEKVKLHSDNKKSKTDITEKIKTQTVQQESEIITAKYEETINSMKIKITAISNENLEYSKAIKEFLRKIHNRRKYESHRNSNENENESEASEREAHETACNILNMTPEELSGLINGKTFNSINPWIVELNRILSENHFSGNLSNFLFRKAMKKLRT